MLCKQLRSFALLVALCCAASVARAQDPTPQADPGDPESIRQDQPTFLVRAAVNHTSRSYREREHLSVRVVSEVDAYVYVVYTQADGKVFQIFPNALQTDNHVQAQQAVQIPASDDPFRWQIGAPFGKEVVKVFASKEPLKGLSDESLRAERFNPVSAKQIAGVAKELDGEEGPEWAEADVEIITRPANQPSAQTPPKRYGVFFGVSEHRFNAEKLEAAQKGFNLSSPRNDAISLNNVLTKLGKLTASRVYTNEKATRKNLEVAVTDWLPRISRPGDTVVIYFSGHGASIDGDDGTKNSGAALVPHDYMGLDVFRVLKKRAHEHKLAADLVPLVDEAQQLINEAGSGAKAYSALVRQTGVSDDLFGHWLQRLDGRQVLVILDVCHAGAFAKDGKSKDLEDDDAPIAFNFLKNNLTRLKSIGQEESALLAACSASQLSLVRSGGDFSVMTYYLIESLKHSSRKLTLQEAHRDCQVGMKRYFAERDRARKKGGQPPDRVHEPYLFNYCSRPALLKP